MYLLDWEFCCVKTIGSCVMCIMRSPWILHAADLMLGVMMIDEWDHFLLFIAEWWLTFLCWLPLCADVADREISYAVTAEVCLQLNYWYLLSLDWFCLFKMVSWCIVGTIKDYDLVYSSSAKIKVVFHLVRDSSFTNFLWLWHINCWFGCDRSFKLDVHVQVDWNSLEVRIVDELQC